MFGLSNGCFRLAKHLEKRVDELFFLKGESPRTLLPRRLTMGEEKLAFSDALQVHDRLNRQAAPVASFFYFTAPGVISW